MGVFFAWWGLSILAFGFGSCAGGPLYLLVPALLSAAAWLFAGRKAANACLAFSVTVAAAGILLKAPAAPMIAGAAASLGLWNASAPKPSSRRGASSGLALLVVSAGTAVAVVGSYAEIDLPFWGVLACAAACAFCLDRASRSMRRSRKG